MATLGAAIALVVGLLAALRLFLAWHTERDARRHSWRMELVQTRAQAWKADVLEELRQRIQRLELKVTR